VDEGANEVQRLSGEEKGGEAAQDSRFQVPVKTQRTMQRTVQVK
jgi:hypothetical protein